MAGDTNLTVLQELLSAQEAGQTVVMATVVRTRGSVPRHAGAKLLVYEDGRQTGTVGGGELEGRVIQEAHEVLQDGRPRMLSYSLVEPQRGDPGVCGGEVEVYLEPFMPPLTVLVIGCGHVGREVADLAHWLGYRVAVTDDREELASPAQVPNADIYLPGSIESALEQFQVTGNTFVTVVTRNVEVDRRILPGLLKTPAPFIGVMGSRRRWETTRRLLLEDGMTETELARCHSPLGLELNAESPKEIAVSVMAEIIMLRRRGAGGRMSTDE